MVLAQQSDCLVSFFCLDSSIVFSAVLRAVPAANPVLGARGEPIGVSVHCYIIFGCDFEV